MLGKESMQVGRKTIVVILTILAIGVVVAGLWYLQNIVMIIFTAYLLMLALQKPIQKLLKWTRLPKTLVIIAMYILFLLVAIGAISLILPAFINETAHFISQIDLSALAPGLAEEIMAFNFTLSEISDIFSRFASSFGALFSLVGGTFGVLFMGVTLFVISMHFSFEYGQFYKKIYWFTKDQKKILKWKKFTVMLEKELGGWISGQAGLMLVMGLLVGLGLFLIGVPYALPLGILAGSLEIVPNIGPIIAAIPAVILSMLYGGVPMTIWTLAFSIVVQQLENVFIVPTIMKNTANVSPMISIILILAGMQLFGVAGALLAVPAYIGARSIYSFWFKDKVQKYLNANS